jgi:glycosyltransferase involved in cell wall biosynthesis
VFESARRAVKEHCERSGIDADITTLPSGFIQCARRPKTRPLVSIIIPTRGDCKRIWGLETCLAANAIQSVLQISTWQNLEIIVVHDRVDGLDKDLLALVDDEKVKIIWYDKPFDFSDKCNLGVLSSKGDIVVFLNDDTEIISPTWIETMVGFLEDDVVGMVGPMTLLEDGRIQSAGHGNNPSPHNLGAGEPCDSTGPFGERLITREVSGVTGACLSMRKEDYLRVGGMSAVFPHSFNDVDLAFKVLAEGLRILWTPIARIWHFESLTRDSRVREEEFNKIHARWGTHFGDDRYTRT